MDVEDIDLLEIKSLDLNECIRDLKTDDKLSFTYDLKELLRIIYEANSDEESLEFDDVLTNAEKEALVGKGLDVVCTFERSKVKTIEYNISSIISFFVDSDVFEYFKLVIEVDEYGEAKNEEVPNLDDYELNSYEFKKLTANLEYYLNPELELELYCRTVLVGDELVLTGELGNKSISKKDLTITGDYDLSIAGDYPVVVSYKVYNRVFEQNLVIKVVQPEYVIEPTEANYQYIMGQFVPSLQVRFYDKAGFSTIDYYVDSEYYTVENLYTSLSGLQTVTISYTRLDVLYTKEISVEVIVDEIKPLETKSLGVNGTFGIVVDRYYIYGNTNYLYKYDLVTRKNVKTLLLQYSPICAAMHNGFLYLATGNNDSSGNVYKINFDTFNYESCVGIPFCPYQIIVDRYGNVIVGHGGEEKNSYKMALRIDFNSKSYSDESLYSAYSDLHYINSTDQVLISRLYTSGEVALLSRSEGKFYFSTAYEHEITEMGFQKKAAANDKYVIYISTPNYTTSTPYHSFHYVNLSSPSDFESSVAYFPDLAFVEDMMLVDCTIDNDTVYLLYEAGNQKFFVIYDLLTDEYSYVPFEVSDVKYNRVINYGDYIYLFSDANNITTTYTKASLLK